MAFEAHVGELEARVERAEGTHYEAFLGVSEEELDELEGERKINK